MIAFISSPYSSPNPEVKRNRFETVLKIVGALQLKNPHMHFFSPIAYGIPIVNAGGNLPDTYEYWNDFCNEFVGVSGIVYMLNMPDYDVSNGMRMEKETAMKLGKRIQLIDWEAALEGEIRIIDEL